MSYSPSASLASPITTSFESPVPVQQSASNVDLNWYPPEKSWINDLDQVVHGRGTHAFFFNGSQLPEGVEYGTYNWCNMPHVRREEYVVVPHEEFELVYVEVCVLNSFLFLLVPFSVNKDARYNANSTVRIHRHHKRTPYASNTFPKESYPWSCSDSGLFFYGQPLDPHSNRSSSTYWSVQSNPINPFSHAGFNGSCQFPQITKQGLDDSWQHGKDLYGVYHDLLGFLPDDLDAEKVTYRVTNNIITSQVASMVVSGMYAPSDDIPLHVQPKDIDSLEPRYPCPKASALYASYGVGSKAANWTAHLTAAKSLFESLDAVSNIPSHKKEWHESIDHYYDNLSARQCHGKPLPCHSSSDKRDECVTQEQADTVYRLGQYEYSFIHRDAPQSLSAAVGSYGVFLAELASNIRNAVERRGKVVYRHNVAHDGSVSRLLSLLQVEQMVWVGMGSEVVFEVYRGKGEKGTDDERSGDIKGESGGGREMYIRILWCGQVLRSSSPTLREVDMLDLNVFLDYVDGLVGERAGKVVDMCKTDM